jgi:hypothetical protein
MLPLVLPAEMNLTIPAHLPTPPPPPAAAAGALATAPPTEAPAPAPPPAHPAPATPPTARGCAATCCFAVAAACPFSKQLPFGELPSASEAEPTPSVSSPQSKASRRPIVRGCPTALTGDGPSGDRDPSSKAGAGAGTGAGAGAKAGAGAASVKRRGAGAGAGAGVPSVNARRRLVAGGEEGLPRADCDSFESSMSPLERESRWTRWREREREREIR